MNLSNIRAKEVDDKEVFLDVNDLIIELLRDVDKCCSEAEHKAYQTIVAKLVELRKKAHAKAAANGNKP